VYVIENIKKIAKIKGIGEDEVAAQLVKNAVQLFRLQ
jgi:Tat protein secretion system quality control protein TatD with DNase activity